MHRDDITRAEHHRRLAEGLALERNGYDAYDANPASRHSDTLRPVAGYTNVDQLGYSGQFPQASHVAPVGGRDEGAARRLPWLMALAGMLIVSFVGAGAVMNAQSPARSAASGRAPDGARAPAAMAATNAAPIALPPGAIAAPVPIAPTAAPVTTATATVTSATDEAATPTTTTAATTTPSEPAHRKPVQRKARRVAPSAPAPAAPVTTPREPASRPAPAAPAERPATRAPAPNDEAKRKAIETLEKAMAEKGLSG